MREVKLNIPLNDFFKVYLAVLTGGNGLTSKELEVLGEIAKATILFPQDMFYPLSSHYRKQLQKTLNMSVYNFNNYITSLKSKKAILSTEEGYAYINPAFLPAIDRETSTSKLHFEFNIIQ